MRSVSPCKILNWTKLFAKIIQIKIKKKMFKFDFQQHNPCMHAHQYISMHQRLCVDGLMSAGLVYVNMCMCVRECLHLCMSKWMNIKCAYASLGMNNESREQIKLNAIQ